MARHSIVSNHSGWGVIARAAKSNATIFRTWARRNEALKRARYFPGAFRKLPAFGIRPFPVLGGVALFVFSECSARRLPMSRESSHGVLATGECLAQVRCRAKSADLSGPLDTEHEFSSSRRRVSLFVRYR